MPAHGIRTPSRPDLNSIFNTRQRKPRSSQAKSAHAKSKEIAVVPGDLLQLYASKLENQADAVKEIGTQSEQLNVKRLRPEVTNLDKQARRRIDGSSSLTTESNESDVSALKIKTDRIPTVLSTPTILQSTAELVPVGSNDSKVRNCSSDIIETVPPISRGQGQHELASSTGRTKRLTRAQLLMNSAVVPNRDSFIPEIVKDQPSANDQFKLEFLQPGSIVNGASTVPEADKLSQVIEWSAKARRLITPELHLPVRLQNLKEIFKAVETTMSVHKARRQLTVPFPDLSSGVESIVKKTFTMSYLAQIVYLFPLGYSLHNKVVRNLESGRSDNVIFVSMTDLPETAELNQLQRNQHRLDCFHDCLLKFVFEYYVQWIKNSYPDRHEEIKSSGLLSLKSWHPEFPLERCPAVPLCKLPSPPPSASSIHLSRLVGPRDPVQIENKIETPSEEGSCCADIPDELRDIPVSLIHRVRLKEAAALKLSEQIGTKTQIQTDLDLDSLPDFVVLVHGMFSAFGKPSMLFSAFIAQLKFKLKDQFVSEGSILKRIDLLMELLPNFCQKITVGRVEAFRIDLTANVAHLRAELRYAIKRKKADRSK